MNETPSAPMPSDLLKKGREKARARTEIFAGQEPKGDVPVLSVDVKAVVPPVIDTAAVTATDAMDKQLAESKGVRRRETKGKNVAVESKSEQDIEKEFLAYKDSWLKKVADMKSVEDFLQGRTEGDIFNHITGVLQENFHRILNSGPDGMRKKLKHLDDQFFPFIKEIDTAYGEKKFILQKDEWTVEKLLKEIPDGTTFSLRKADGNVKTFRRDGDKFVTTTKKPAKANGAVLRILTHGGELVIENEPAKVIEAEPAVTVVETEKPVDIPFVVENPGNNEEKPLSEKRDKLSLSIDELKNEVAKARARWVETDVKNTTAWKKFKSLFGIEKDTKKDDAQIEYENALKKLQDAEMDMMRKGMAEDGMILSPQDIQEGTERLLRYYKLDEVVNLINERTLYKSEHFSDASSFEKITVLLGNIGRAYNRIPLKGKLAITAAFLGITAATAMSGGSGTAVGALAFVSFARKIASGAGVAVGTEALLESFGERGRKNQAEKEIKEQLGTLGTESLGAKPEVTFDALNALLDKDIASLDTKLQSEKRAKTWRKLGAIGVGGLVGSGWLTQFATEKLGVGDWIKDHFGSAPVVPNENPVVHSGTIIPTEKILSPSDVLDTLPKVPLEPSLDGSVAKVGELLQTPYEVKSGDSIWKIIGSRVEGLEGAQKTHFIDALKDKLADLTSEEVRNMGIQSGDINSIAVGEKIDFSKFTQVDLEQAFEHARDLSPEKIASIAMNDAKIAEYVSTHPGTTLTDEGVDRILHGNTMDTGEGNGQPLGTEKEPLVFMAQDDSSVDTEEWNMKNDSLQYEKDAVLGKTYNMESYRDYFYKNPDTLPQFRKIGESYREFVFQGNQASINTMGGKMFNELGSLPSEPLEKFVQIARETYGSKLGLPRSTEKVYEYIARMAMIGVENSNGKIMRFPQSV